MKKIVVDMQNFLFGDSIAAAFKNSNYDIDVVRAETPQDTVELCRVYKPFVLVMEVTAYTPWLLCERMKLRDEVKTTCPDCISKRIKANNGERNKYYIENNHPAIIDAGTFARVQEEIARRSGTVRTGLGTAFTLNYRYAFALAFKKILVKTININKTFFVTCVCVV